MKVEVHLLGGLRKIIDIDPYATRGAVVGKNLFFDDGTIVTRADFGGGSAPDDGTAITSWELILNIPPNVVALAEATGTGLFAVTGASTGAMRTLADSATIEWANGDGVAGNPVASLKELPDTGIGAALVKLTRDGYGRVEGTEAATTDDLTEGETNLYFTAARVRATVLTGLSLASSAAITAADTVLSAFGKLQAQITALASSLTGYVPTSRTISTTAPLGGGGDLSANRTLTISAATTGAAGSMSAADKTKLNGIATGATAYTDALARAAVIASAITDGDTTHAPSGDAVFDALSGKYDKTGGDLSGNMRVVKATSVEAQFELASGAAIARHFYRDTDFNYGMYLTGADGLTKTRFRFDGTNMSVETPLLAINGNTAWHSGNFDPTSKQDAGFITGSSTYARFHSTTGDSVGGALWITGTPNFSYRIDGSEYFTVSSLGNTTFGGPSGSTYARPRVDNAVVLGGPSNRWSVVYAVSGSINTSDAREKTAVVPLTSAEIAAAKQLAGEIGTFQWLASIEQKGSDAARRHVGLTVQRVMEIMQEHGLDPFRYAFICYDEWDETPEQSDPEVGEVTQEYRPAGNRYSLRPDQLNLFLARGFDARLKALEG